MTPTKKTGVATPAGVLHCHHRRKLKHGICPLCHHSFDFCPECEDGAECCAKCKQSVTTERQDWFAIMRQEVDGVAA